MTDREHELEVKNRMLMSALKKAQERLKKSLNSSWDGNDLSLEMTIQDAITFCEAK